ncbi:BLUF domain-containing protein [Erythrobacter rubeus]|uniref:BLUF domain-containing protein n=1 Tax=Erythrobacter rubeus TaxID=2760803 RepID=A0ABR8KNI0_9SPHN|nr:BLUF domain-containing protein [Erythrobacter rubeus]MBD2842228.1 BLUF domain-containing protein [Erythrobacter rubeus]
MIRLIYQSEATDKLGAGEVFKIVETSAENNAESDLTGFLLFVSGRFFQVIEGPEDSIDDLVQRLENDPRHRSIQTIDRRPIDERAFGTWRMKRFMPTSGATSLREVAPELRDVPAYMRQTADAFLAS